MPPTVTYTGRMDYIERASGKVRGEEAFTVGRDGDRRFQASMVNIFDSGISRLIFMEFDAAWRPVHATCSVRAGDRSFGHTFFDFDGKTVRALHRSRDYGHFLQEKQLDAPVQAFGSHSVIGDGLQILGLDRIEPGETRRFENRLSSNELSNGGSLQMITPGYSGTGEPAVLHLQRFPNEVMSFQGRDCPVERYDLSRIGKPPLSVWLSREMELPLMLAWDVYGSVYRVTVLERLGEAG
jgi:hypothetical protein